MILVINLNASVDKRYTLSELTKGKVMRAASVDNTPGGKGIHVANVATILGEECLTTGMLGGKSGEFIADRLEDYGIRQDFVRVAGETRSCLAIITDDGVQTEILEPGPQVSGAELEIFRQKYNELLEAADIIVASGSVPRGVPADFYARLIQEARAAAKPFLLDTSGELLRQGIAAGLARGLAVEDVLKLAAACGTANAMEPESGFVRRAVVEELLGRIQVERL